MNEKLTAQQRRKGHKLGGAAVALGLLVGGAAGYIEGGYVGRGEPSGKQPVEVSLEEGVEKYAKAMEAALNRGEVFTGATVMIHNEFVINADAQEKLGIDSIYVPINMGSGKYAYANVDQETGEVSLNLVDAEDGTFVGDVNSNRFSPFVGDIKVQEHVGGDAYVLAIDDPLQMYVGQSSPHIQTSN